MKQWLELLRQLGDSVLELAAAEVGALSDDLRRGGRQAVRALALLVAAVVLATLAWALVTVAVVTALGAAIGLWQAALAVAAVYAVVAIALGLVARGRWRAIEPPVETVRRRIEEQRAWFHDRILDRGSREGTLAGESDQETLTGDSP